eukprot:6087611-Amphidinium_carterae.2
MSSTSTNDIPRLNHDIMDEQGRAQEANMRLDRRQQLPDRDRHQGSTQQLQQRHLGLHQQLMTARRQRLQMRQRAVRQDPEETQAARRQDGERQQRHQEYRFHQEYARYRANDRSATRKISYEKEFDKKKRGYSEHENKDRVQRHGATSSTTPH